MERTLNKVELRGNVGADPRITELGNGARVIRFSVATHETFKTKDGILKEETTWHNVAGWYNKSMPEFEKIKKGTFVEIVGKLKYSKYLSKDGSERYSTDIVVQKMSILQ